MTHLRQKLWSPLEKAERKRLKKARLAETRKKKGELKLIMIEESRTNDKKEKEEEKIAKEKKKAESVNKASSDANKKTVKRLHTPQPSNIDAQVKTVSRMTRLKIAFALARKKRLCLQASFKEQTRLSKQTLLSEVSSSTDRHDEATRWLSNIQNLLEVHALKVCSAISATLLCPNVPNRSLLSGTLCQQRRNEEDLH